jgi:hypothetical protein
MFPVTKAALAAIAILLIAPAEAAEKKTNAVRRT